MKSLALLFLLSFFLLFSCEQNKKTATLEGSWKLLSLQDQNDTIFKPMEGITILKIFTAGKWISPAYKNKTHQVVHLAGGTYTFDGKEMTEKLEYHSKDTLNIGHVSKYFIKFMGDTLYQSGIYKAGTPEEWKVEEYWIREE